MYSRHRVLWWPHHWVREMHFDCFFNILCNDDVFIEVCVCWVFAILLTCYPKWGHHYAMWFMIYGANKPEWASVLLINRCTFPLNCSKVLLTWTFLDYSVFICFHMQLYHDYHQACPSLTISCTVDKILFCQEPRTHQNAKIISFQYFDRYTNLQYDISIEPQKLVLDIYRIPVHSPL